MLLSLSESVVFQRKAIHLPASLGSFKTPFRILAKQARRSKVQLFFKTSSEIPMAMRSGHIFSSLGSTAIPHAARTTLHATGPWKIQSRASCVWRHLWHPRSRNCRPQLRRWGRAQHSYAAVRNMYMDVYGMFANIGQDDFKYVKGKLTELTQL